MNRTLAVTLAALAALLLLLLPLAGCRDQGSGAEAEVWYCPMHPEYTSDRPGTCPICNMDLVRRETEAKPAPVSTAAPTPGERRVLYYRNPMNPTITSPTPAKDEMGMDYVPVYADEAGGAAAGTIAGRAPVELGAEARALAGVATAPARRATWSGGIRTVGTVVADERRTYRIEARFAGWVEALQADFAGRRVAAGETLAEIFSPELVAAQQEYLLARQAGARFTGSSLAEVRRGGEDLIAAARRRLEIFALPPGFIEALEGSGVPRRTVPVVAPAAGYLVDKQVFAGQQVMPGQELFRLVDLSRVWVEARLYEIDAARVALGESGRLSLPYERGVVRTGRVTYVYPEVDPATRTLRVRFDVPNGDLAWKPGMFVDVELAGRPREVLVVPDAAVLDTGERRLVFVETAPGRFEPREVGVGERREGQAEILSGLRAGEMVAVKANFLLDSESRLRAAIAGSSGAPTPAPAGDEGHR